MDNATERRGRKTLHAVFSPKKAVLIAYDLIDMAYDIWINNNPPHIGTDTWLNFLKCKLQRLLVGQLYDLDKSGTLAELASLKTGVLFELITETVALCTGLNAQFWKIWGNNLGILFQWMDDFLDMEEDKQQNNRNAFNEDYTNTLNTYKEMWKIVESCIGKQWFETDMGIFMKQYFKSKFEFDTDTNQFENLISIGIKSPIDFATTEFDTIPNSIKQYVNNYLIELSDEEKLPLMGIKYADNLIKFSFLNGKSMLKHIWRYLDHINTITTHIKHHLWKRANSIRYDLWKKDETEWEEYTAKAYGTEWEEYTTKGYLPPMRPS
jgi:hypothetical protein